MHEITCDGFGDRRCGRGGIGPKELLWYDHAMRWQPVLLVVIAVVSALAAIARFSHGDRGFLLIAPISIAVVSAIAATLWSIDPKMRA